MKNVRMICCLLFVPPPIILYIYICPPLPDSSFPRYSAFYPMSQQQPPISDDADIVRPFDRSKDEHMVKMLVGQGVMEGLARANNKSKPAKYRIKNPSL